MEIMVLWFEYFFTMLVIAWGIAGAVWSLIYFTSRLMDKGHSFLPLVLLTCIIAAIFATAGVFLGKS